MIGAIDVESDQPAAFNHEDIYTLRTLADQIAVAIHEARLYAAEREQAWISTALLQVADATGHATSLEEVLDTVVAHYAAVVRAGLAYRPRLLRA